MNKRSLGLALSLSILLSGCADVSVPGTRDLNIPAPELAGERQRALNEVPDSVIYLPLGNDVLVPTSNKDKLFSDDIVGPFELRGETLAGALQLILDGYDTPIAFQTDEGLTRTVTVTNLKGPVGNVVSTVCGLADLYCAVEDGILVIKELETFTVTIPPIGDTSTLLGNISGAIEAITGQTPVVDESTRTIIYQASHRTSEVAERYFQRLRSNTAMIVFETYIWEVSLNNGNSAGIDWERIGHLDDFDIGISFEGTTDPSLGTPVSIGLPTKGNVSFGTDDIFKFISKYGAVKTISQPQITMLSGSSARLRVADTQNYVSEITRTSNDGVESVSTTTDSVDTGFTLNVDGSWDSSTVYGRINISLNEVRDIETFADNPDAIVQLPQTTEREVETQIRIRPGDSLLLAGLVRETDAFDSSGPGADTPIFPTSRSVKMANVELVFLMKPRVVVYVEPEMLKQMTAAQRTELAAGAIARTTKSHDAAMAILPKKNSIKAAITPPRDHAPLFAFSPVAKEEEIKEIQKTLAQQEDEKIDAAAPKPNKDFPTGSISLEALNPATSME